MKDMQKTEANCEKARTSYEKPEVTILEFESEDIITTSGGALDSADITGGSKGFIGSWFGQ